MREYIQFFWKSKSVCLFWVSCVLLGSSGNVAPANVVLENTFFRYEIAGNGRNVSFLDKSGGKDLLKAQKASFCSDVTVNGKVLPVKSVELKEGLLEMRYSGVNGSVVLDVAVKPDRISLKVVSAPELTESLTILNVPLSLEAQPYEPFGACVLSMNLFTHVRQLPPLQTHLWAKCYQKFGLKGAEVTLLGLPQKDLLPVIRDVMSKAADVPPSQAGGAWAADAKEGYGSYLMNFGTLTEETADEWIETCKSLGFNQIDSHGGAGFFDFGTLELNKEKWPEGWDSFKRINAKLRENGISHIFHTYAFFIDKSTHYVTPVPHKDLGYARTFTLAEPVTETSDVITVNESTANISTITGFHTENSVTLRLGDELIEFSEVTRTPPYQFKGLKRGANGTRTATHAQATRALHMSERFGRFVPDPDSELFRQIAEKHASIVNECGFKGIYLDAIDGANVLGGEEHFWYYGTKFVFEIAKNLKSSVGMEMSSMSHHWWHYRSRWQAWDRAVRGYKRFIDIHLASVKNPSLFLPEKMKSNEWEHGLWRGNTPLIDKFAGVKNGQTMLPLHLGWWGNQTWDPPQIEPTFPDDVEYLAVKMLSNDAGYSQLGGVDAKTLKTTPLFSQAAGIIRRYEKLRHQKYFDESVLAKLRQPGKDFTLVGNDEDGWTFKPRKYEKHKVLGHDHESKAWKVGNDFRAQPLKVRIEPLMSVKPYDDASGIVLADFSTQTEFSTRQISEGVSGRIAPGGETTRKQENTLAFTARNAGQTPPDAAYINAEKTYHKGLSLRDNKGLGVWIKGDGNGQLLNLSLRSPDHISHGAHGDRFVRIDFKGWKYFELVEIESSAISDYVWPDDSHFYVYDSYRHTIDFAQIDRFQLWYNNLPAGKEVRTVIGPVKALPLVETTIKNPAVTIGDKTITFPVEMQSGMYLEFYSDGDCKLYDAKGNILSEVKIEGEVPVLNSGVNELRFGCESNREVSPRVQVTVISEGNPMTDVKNKSISR
ncbi:hypothetical protein GCM10023091_12230 [Ravibacter arvi]|uniref:Uncharacterized protein n=1 Tax=Ravibacter arvi TaxID=2051041 RepID=A0ABP8LTY3_9BACT